MHPILEKLNDYLANASEEQLSNDWEELKGYNSPEYGPYIEDLLDNILKGRYVHLAIKKAREAHLPHSLKYIVLFEEPIITAFDDEAHSLGLLEEDWHVDDIKYFGHNIFLYCANYKTDSVRQLIYRHYDRFNNSDKLDGRMLTLACKYLTKAANLYEQKSDSEQTDKSSSEKEDELCERYYDTIRFVFKDYSDFFEVSMQQGNNFTAKVPVQKKLANPSKETVYKYIEVNYGAYAFTFTFVVDNTGCYIYGYDPENTTTVSHRIIPSDSEKTADIITELITKNFID